MNKLKCPVCGELVNGEFDICTKCGWEYDPLQNDEVYFAGGANELSLVEYKDLYNDCVLKKKDFKYLIDGDMIRTISDKLENPPYYCKSCGIERINNLGEKCNHCGWISSPYQEYFKDKNNLLNHDSLNEHKKTIE